MSYAGICFPEKIQDNADPHFHGASYDQITDYVGLGAGASCASVTSTGNQPPVVDAGADYTIPAGTPFTLSGSAVDPDGDLLSFAWEQFDLGGECLSVQRCGQHAGTTALHLRGSRRVVPHHREHGESRGEVAGQLARQAHVPHCAALMHQQGVRCGQEPWVLVPGDRVTDLGTGQAIRHPLQSRPAASIPDERHQHVGVR